jgi:hypothetical protein
VFGGRFGGILTCVTLIDVRDLDRLAGLSLHPLGEFGELGAILFTGGCYTQGEQMPERIDRQMNFIAFPVFGPAVASASAAPGRSSFFFSPQSATGR